MVALEIAAAQLSVVMRADVVDGVRDAIHTRDGERPALRGHDGALSFAQVARRQQVHPGHGPMVPCRCDVERGEEEGHYEDLMAVPSHLVAEAR